MAGPARRDARARRGRLSRSAEFDRVYRHGRARANRYLVLYSFPRGSAAPRDGTESGPRLGVSVSRKVGGAVERNRVKRLLREAFWSKADHMPTDHDFVVVARPEARSLGEREGLAGIARALGELLAGAGAEDGGVRKGAAGE